MGVCCSDIINYNLQPPIYNRFHTVNTLVCHKYGGFAWAQANDYPTIGGIIAATCLHDDGTMLSGLQTEACITMFVFYS
jgi:hypothetical protein